MPQSNNQTYRMHTEKVAFSSQIKLIYLLLQSIQALGASEKGIIIDHAIGAARVAGATTMLILLLDRSSGQNQI